MTDYGHSLEFGTFLTPDSSSPDRVVSLARLTETLGLDLVSFQDHPYQPAHLEAWTLISYVAATTERVRLAGNVLNLPLRQPAVLAKAVASLDLLTGGRVELGLGSGAFWDAIVAMGEPRRSPSEALQALEEAIDVIRGIWDPWERRALRIDGQHYRVVGARRGPEPAHDVQIWVGAYKPRMLRLVGRKADGWLPSLGYLEPKDLAESNRRIDEAAAEAGRHPSEIRRLLNISGRFTSTPQGFLDGPTEQWVEQLSALALEDGVATFILGSDDPASIETFAREVAPEVRRRVEKERVRRPPSPRPPRSPRALSLRREGIDYDAVPASLRDRAVEPGDRDFRRLRSTYVYSGEPGLVLRPQNPEQVAEALTFARSQSVPLAIRSGGHGISSKSTNDGGVVIDLGALNTVDIVDPSARRLHLGPAATWGQVAGAIADYGWAITSGDFGDVGVGGLATAGGIGFMSRLHGLTIDHLTGAQVVLADGRIVDVGAEDEPDLFWAVRGAGANFGIVTRFEVEANQVPDVVFAVVVFDATDTAGLLERWGEMVEASPREFTSFMTLIGPRSGLPPVAYTYSVYADDNVGNATLALESLLAVGPVAQQQAHLTRYANILPPQNNRHTGGPGIGSRTGMAVHLGSDLSAALAKLVEERMATIQIRPTGGAVNDIPAEATAFAHRHQNFAVSASSVPARTRLDPFWDEEVYPLLDGLYLSFETDTRPERLLDAFPEPTFSRLRRLKARYDPDGVFNQNFPIPPAAT